MAEVSSHHLTSTIAPATQEELAALVADAYSNSTAIYPIGGGTSLDYGLPAKQPGIGVELKQLNCVIDFPARDLTITVEAGITMQALAEVLAQEGLRLPVDVPHPERATLGGVIATGWSGPRRYGHGTIRDFVIGIRAIDGRGETFNGGGRVVKNVAGYDFCKLLTGSLGTIGIIMQVTLKLRPVVEKAVYLEVSPNSLDDTDRLLQRLSESVLTLGCIELYSGQFRQSSHLMLCLGFEGTKSEVDWNLEQAFTLLSDSGTAFDRTQVFPWELNERWALKLLYSSQPFHYRNATGVKWKAVFSEPEPDERDPRIFLLRLKASVRPVELIRFIKGVAAIEPQSECHAHAGNGIIYISFPDFPKDGLSRMLVGKLQPLAAQCGGHIVILSNPGGQEMTPQSVWGNIGPQLELMQAVKRQFDPRGILNPGRFVV